MSEAKHTAGPWVFTGYENDIGPDDEGFWEWWSVDDSKGDMIAEAKGLRSDAENEANARLIAAAPDLLEAVCLAFELSNDGLVDFEKYNLTRDVDIQEKYRAAIAKATGDTQ